MVFLTGRVLDADADVDVDVLDGGLLACVADTQDDGCSLLVVLLVLVLLVLFMLL